MCFKNTKTISVFSGSQLSNANGRIFHNEEQSNFREGPSVSSCNRISKTSANEIWKCIHKKNLKGQ